uniref:hypothetical protein n=1 Tax=Aliarcobacter sp. TaxID=2321116 RepID=UPI0040485288
MSYSNPGFNIDYLFGSILLFLLIVLYFVKKYKKNKVNKTENPEVITKTKELIINGNETYNVTSNFVNIIGSLFFLLSLILGIFTKNEFWGMFLVGIVGASLIMWVGNFLYMFTPFHWKKQNKVDEIYEYFKCRFHVLNNFDPDKHLKVSEFNEQIKPYSKTLENDHLMFNIYMKAYNEGADAVLLNTLNNKEINCTLVKYK